MNLKDGKKVYMGWFEVRKGEAKINYIIIEK